MNRRDFIKLVGATAFSGSHAAFAQTAGLPVVGVLVPFNEDDDYNSERMNAIRKGLQDGGFIEGRNCVLAIRYTGGNSDRVPSAVKELAALGPRVVIILASGAVVTNSLYPQLPIVITSVAADLINLGLAKNYARPGGMVTGNVQNAVGGEESVIQKRISLFKELVPDLKRLALIALDIAAERLSEKVALEKMATHFGYEFKHYRLDQNDAERGLQSAFEAGRRDDVNAFYISGHPFMVANRSSVLRFASAAGKPTVGAYSIWGRSRLLMSYSVDVLDQTRQAGTYAARILKGEKPGDLPIEQAKKFSLVVNLKTAKMLGITAPPNLLALADEVIE